MIYPSSKHAAKVFERLLKLDQKIKPVIYLESNRTCCRDDTDRELSFHQEANFMYLTGAKDLRGGSVVINLLPEFDHRTKEKVTPEDVFTTLFIPNLDPDEVMWCGLPPKPEELLKSLPNLNEVKYQDQLLSHLTQFNKPQLILVLPNSKTDPKGLEINSSSNLLKALHQSRTIKTEEEIQIMKLANQISSQAHETVMKTLSKEKFKCETDPELIFVNECKRLGSNHQAYLPIFGHGTNAGTLHYVNNNEKISDSFNGLLLMDAGCEMMGYASDITRTIPLSSNGKFNDQCKEIYEIVLEMQEKAIETIAPGVDWNDIQILMHKIAAKGLLKLGILQNLSIDECYEGGHVIPFFPHGIGHFLGLDTHDVDGLPNGKSTLNPAFKYLRLQRRLEAGNVVTVEPGIYFNQFLLEPFKESKFINHELLKKYMNVGGIRIEDNVVVRENGYENLTTAVKSIEDIERLCGERF
ncbi:Xaa-Pro dipeptidase [Melampsora americana]|nr:Xaa-Pro dipeptidase [Melampsora americana]